jgi:hypothetical protein
MQKNLRSGEKILLLWLLDLVCSEATKFQLHLEFGNCPMIVK